MTARYAIQAYNLYDSISIKAIKALLQDQVINSSPVELQVRHGPFSYFFVYRFGSLVFFNMPAEAIEGELARIKELLGVGLSEPTTESYQVSVHNDGNRVEFEYVQIEQSTLPYLSLIAMTVGQSAALEYFEANADQKLREISEFMQRLGATGKVPVNAKLLLKFIGSAGWMRQHIISNLSILDSPEEVWTSKDLERLFKERQLNFDIHVRFRTLDRKLSLVQDHMEILSDLVASRRANILELMVVALFVLELLLSAFRMF